VLPRAWRRRKIESNEYARWSSFVEAGALYGCGFRRPDQIGAFSAKVEPAPAGLLRRHYKVSTAILLPALFVEALQNGFSLP